MAARISVVYPTAMVGLALLAAVAAGVVGYAVAERALIDAADAKLIALRDARAAALASRLARIRADLRLLGSSELVRTALPAFASAYAQLGSAGPAGLRRLYVDASPLPVGERGALDNARDGSKWSGEHARFHPWFRRYIEARNYYDLMLVSPGGDVVYTVEKEADFATNLRDGPWRESGLAAALATALAGAADAVVLDGPLAGRGTALRRSVDVEPRALGFVDFRAYAPSHGAPAAFVSTPIVDSGNALLGVLVLQLPIWQIDEDVQSGAAIGDRAQTILVGPDGLMRSESRFSKVSTVLSARVDTPAARAALAGESGVGRILDYRGVPVLSAWAPLDFLGERWAIVAEVEESEVLAPVARMREMTALAVAAAAVLVALLGVLLARRLSRPITAITTVMDRLAEGEVEVDIPYRDRKDEIGEMAAAMQVFEQRTRDLRREIKLRTEAEQTARAMQQELLPWAEDVRRYEDRHRIAVVSHFEPSSTLSGDFWGMESIDETRLGVYIVDFAGHGVNAALNTFRLHALLNHIDVRLEDPPAFLREVNTSLSKMLSRGQFATMLCGVIDTAADRFTYAAAAATHPLIALPGGAPPVFAESAGLPLGLFAEAEHELRTIDFPAGACLLLYSDALTESPDREGRRLDTEGLLALATGYLASNPPEGLFDHVLATFRAGRDRGVPDDLTIISLTRRR